MKPEYNLTENVIANFGHSPSKECREKISNTLKRRYASGEIVTFKNEQAWIKVYMYDIEKLTLCKIFPNLHYAATYFKSRSTTKKYLLNKVYSNKYYLTDIKFNTRLELYNYYCENYLVNIGNTGTKKYLNVACNNWRCVLKYAKQVDQFGISRSMLFKNVNCSKSSPYISTKHPDLKFYYSNVFELFSENAVVYGKPKQWLKGKIGEIPEMDNSEVNK